MGSSHFGELGLGNNGRSGSSRKGKKSGSEKPKQPQRGLGVAQLEKLRLHNQMAAGYHPFHTNNLNKQEDLRVEMAFSSSPPPSSSSYAATSSGPSLFPLQPNIMMGFGDNERADIRYGELQSSSTARSYSHHSSPFLPPHLAQQTVTLPLMERNTEDSLQKKRRHDRCHSLGSNSQTSDSSDTQELDLDLKLSL